MEKDKPNKEKLFEIIFDSSDLLYEVEQTGLEFRYPIHEYGSFIFEEY